MYCTVDVDFSEVEDVVGVVVIDDYGETTNYKLTIAASNVSNVQR